MALRSIAGTVRRLLSSDPPGDIDHRIAYHIGHGIVARLQVHATTLPHYRFVDLYRATERYCEEYGETARIESEHGEDLNTILHGQRQAWASRRIKVATKIPWPIGPAEEEYLPIDVFWLCKQRTAADGSNLIVRLRYNPNLGAIVEAAADQSNLAEQSVTSIIELGARISIYRNKVLELNYESGVKDEYGNILPTDKLQILFKAHESVDDADIVIDDEIRQMLWRNVIDLHLRREVLKSHHVPVRRGVLLYGPPGTGKTYAC